MAFEPKGKQVIYITQMWSFGLGWLEILYHNHFGLKAATQAEHVRLRAFRGEGSLPLPFNSVSWRGALEGQHVKGRREMCAAARRVLWRLGAEGK